MKYVCGECGAVSTTPGVCDDKPLERADDPLLGIELGRYRLARILGEGGTGRVYLGVQPAIGSRVAIKVLSGTDKETIDRLFVEAKAVNMIHHDSIVGIRDVATLPDKRPYVVMELVDGITLRQVFRDDPSPALPRLVRWLSDVLAGLAAAHAIGVVHRDLKPENIVIATSGRAKVLDFGIAKVIHALPGAIIPRTATGVALGTPDYMAPEQILGRPIDGRADVYAAGIVLFEATTGRRPFWAKNEMEIMRGHIERPVPSAKAIRADLPVALDRVIARALAKDPDERFPSATELAAALQASILEPAKRRWWPF